MATAKVLPLRYDTVDDAAEREGVTTQELNRRNDSRIGGPVRHAPVSDLDLSDLAVDGDEELGE